MWNNSSDPIESSDPIVETNQLSTGQACGQIHVCTVPSHHSISRQRGEATSDSRRQEHLLPLLCHALSLSLSRTSLTHESMFRHQRSLRVPKKPSGTQEAFRHTRSLVSPVGGPVVKSELKGARDVFGLHGLCKVGARYGRSQTTLP